VFSTGRAIFSYKHPAVKEKKTAKLLLGLEFPFIKFDVCAAPPLHSSPLVTTIAIRLPVDYSFAICVVFTCGEIVAENCGSCIHSAQSVLQVL
jgi:hypothetical protein